MQTCMKIEDSRAPDLDNIDEMNVFLKKMANTFNIPGTSNIFPNAVSKTIWMAITDQNEEGKWNDWYSGETKELLDGVFGELGKQASIFEMSFKGLFYRWWKGYELWNNES